MKSDNPAQPSMGASAPLASGSSKPSIGTLVRRPEVGSLIGLIAVFIFFSVFGGANFLTAGGAASWLNVVAELGIVALPIGLLMIAGQLDLSVGSVLPASSMTIAIVSGFYHSPMIVGIVGALVLGLAVGFINGLLVVRTIVPSFVVTLATLFAVAGLTLGFSVILTGSTSVALTSPPVAKLLLGDFVGGKFEVTIFWWIAIILIVGFLLNFPRYGNWILAMGGDSVSARNAGIPTDRLTIALFVGSGLCAAFVGMSQAILYNSAQAAAGQSFIFNSIIAVVIGGVLLTGGYGSVVGIVLGTLTFSIVNQGIYYTGFDANWASLIIGVLLLAAVLKNKRSEIWRCPTLPAPKPRPGHDLSPAQADRDQQVVRTHRRAPRHLAGRVPRRGSMPAR
jgi:simple sugar transport system permease protein